MTTRSRLALFLPAVALAVAACAAPGGSVQSPSATDSGGQHLEVPAGIPAAAWAALLTDLRGRIDHEPADLTVVSADAKAWNDGSLGCPQPGQMYTQALVDGYQVVLEVDGDRYDYRIGRGDDIRLCDLGARPEGDD